MNKLKTETHLSENAVMTSYYLVRYSGGSYEDAFDVVVFVTRIIFYQSKKIVENWIAFLISAM